MKAKVFTIVVLFISFYGAAQERAPRKRPNALTSSHLMRKSFQEDGRNKYLRKSDDFLLNGGYTIYETVSNNNTDIFNSYRDNGFICEGFFIKGFKTGFWKTTYKGKLVKTENWSKGLMIGLYRVYDKDGQIRYKTTFGPQGNGLYRDFYYETGVLKEEGYYKNGKKEGEWCIYDEKGEQTSNLHYDKGLPKEEE